MDVLMLVIGFSTGALAFGDFTRALHLLEPTRANAIELSALRSVELPDLLDTLPSLVHSLTERYRYVSVHAPTDFKDERRLVKQLGVISEIGLNVVVHPDTIKDASLWLELGSRLCLENMDSRKATGRTADELATFFEHLPEAKLCFDIAHARQVDPTMTEAERILSAFGERLVQTHLTNLNSNRKDLPISFSAKRAYEPFAARLSKMPLILESIVGETEIVKEIAEAEKIFQSNSQIPAPC